jgi:hypothetical protein
MSLELIYTSVPQGINSNTRGFCTAAATSGMSRPVIMRLESLSGYEFRYSISDDRVGLNPVNFAHTQINTGTATRSVLSRVAYCGTDYSNRINKIAHHFLLEPGEQLLQGPAWMMLQMRDQIFYDSWTKEAQYLEGRTLTDLLSNNEQPAECTCKHWAKITGDAGWAGVLAKAFKDNKRLPAFVVFDSSLPHGDMLRLFQESLQVLPPAERWGVGFATYYTALPAGCQYHWRGIFSGSPASQEMMRFSGAKVIDLTQPLSQAPDDEYTEAARDGKSIGQGRVQLLIPAGREERADEEPREPRITLADDSDTNIDEKLTPKQATWADRPIRFREGRQPQIPSSNRSVPVPISHRPNRKYHILWFGSATICLLMLSLVVVLWPKESLPVPVDGNGTDSSVSSPPSTVSQKDNDARSKQPTVIDPIQENREKFESLYRKIDKSHPTQDQIDQLNKLANGSLKDHRDIKDLKGKIAKLEETLKNYLGAKNKLDKDIKDLTNRYTKIKKYDVSVGEIAVFVSDAELVKADAKKLSSTNTSKIPPEIDTMIQKAEDIRKVLKDLERAICMLPRKDVEEIKRKTVGPMKRSNPGKGEWFFEVGRSVHIVNLPNEILQHNFMLNIKGEKTFQIVEAVNPPSPSLPFLECSFELQHGQVLLKVDDIVKGDTDKSALYRKMIRHFVIEVAEKTRDGKWIVYQCALEEATLEEEIKMGFTAFKDQKKVYRQTRGNKPTHYLCPWPERLIIRQLERSEDTWPTDRDNWRPIKTEKAELEISRKSGTNGVLEITLISKTIHNLHEEIKTPSDKENKLSKEKRTDEDQKRKLEFERDQLEEELRNLQKGDKEAVKAKKEEIKKKKEAIKKKKEAIEVKNKEIKRKKEAIEKNVQERFNLIKKDISALKGEFAAKAKFEIVDPWGRVVKRFRVTIEDQINHPKELGEWQR